MDKKTKRYLLAVFITIGIAFLGNLLYIFHYYNFFSAQMILDDFISKLAAGLFMPAGFFSADFYSLLPAGEIAKYSVVAAIMLAFFGIAGRKTLKEKKWAFLTAPLTTSALLYMFALGTIVAFSSIIAAFNSYENTDSPNNCLEPIYASLPESINYPFMLTIHLSYFILQAAALAFFLLAAWDLIKKRGLNKFYLASFVILVAVKLIFSMAIY